MQIDGVNALVAGGASGLGAATARALSAAGANVTIADLNEERGAALASEIGARFVATDVTDPDAVEAAVKAAAGDAGLRISISCAGIGPAEKTAGRKGPHSFEL
ncbi:MAG TPA: SDR family NAD(P)-dependent oxidoreductase, partial [Solirubrobacter sp.]